MLAVQAEVSLIMPQSQPLLYRTPVACVGDQHGLSLFLMCPGRQWGMVPQGQPLLYRTVRKSQKEQGTKQAKSTSLSPIPQLVHDSNTVNSYHAPVVWCDHSHM